MSISFSTDDKKRPYRVVLTHLSSSCSMYSSLVECWLNWHRKLLEGHRMICDSLRYMPAHDLTDHKRSLKRMVSTNICGSPGGNAAAYIHIPQISLSHSLISFYQIILPSADWISFDSDRSPVRRSLTVSQSQSQTDSHCAEQCAQIDRDTVSVVSDSSLL